MHIERFLQRLVEREAGMSGKEFAVANPLPPEPGTEEPSYDPVAGGRHGGFSLKRVVANVALAVTLALGVFTVESGYFDPDGPTSAEAANPGAAQTTKTPSQTTPQTTSTPRSTTSVQTTTQSTPAPTGQSRTSIDAAQPKPGPPPPPPPPGGGRGRGGGCQKKSRC